MLLPLLLLGGLSGCAGLSYYWQGLQGQAELLLRARPITELLADPETSPILREKLDLAQRLRRFAVDALALPDNASYTRYTDLGRPYVLWNVFATPALSLRPVLSCFPVAGCVAYRGFFAKEEAESMAEAQRARGLDVFVAGVPAYSTLGWFEDPLPSSVLTYGELELARLIFHELAHQVVYLPDDTRFNESFAVAVEEEGLALWVAARQDHGLNERLAQSALRRKAFRNLIAFTRARLDEVYGNSQAEVDQLSTKARIFEDMQLRYREMRTSWGGFAGYDAWFARAHNNASLLSVALYADQVPQFRALFQACRGDWARFYAAVRTLAQSPQEQRNRRLDGSPTDCAA